MKWEDELIEKLHKIVDVFIQKYPSGGEIHIQMRPRSYKSESSVVPIFRIYPANQIIGKEIKYR